MNKKIVAIVGSYRKGGISDQLVEAVLQKAGQCDVETKKYYLTDVFVEFCTNCRVCANDEASKSRGKCVIEDSMETVLCEIDAADGIILASPVNNWTVTAVMKRFLERLAVYSYWPWGKPAPRSRPQLKKKKAIIITSSACPAAIGKILIPNARQVLKKMAGIVGARVVRSLYVGMASLRERQRLNARQLAAARRAAELLL